MESWLEQLVDQISLFGGRISNKEFKKFINKKYQEEISRPPRIAVLGATGVGKSSTINSLFGTRLRVSHSVAGTMSPQEMTIHMQGKRVRGENGDLVLFDMPGINEDLTKEYEYAEKYNEIISQCDVAVWILSAQNRAYSYDQIYIRDVVTRANEDLASRLVFGINKVDLINPYDWDKDYNLPSEEQEENLEKIKADVFLKFRKICPNLRKERIVGYSSLRRYHLDELFGAMLRACPNNRAWVLNSRKKVANFLDMVSPELREQVDYYMEGNQ